MLRLLCSLTLVISGFAFLPVESFGAGNEDKNVCIRLLTLNNDDIQSGPQTINVDWAALRKNAEMLGMNSDQIDQKMTELRYLTATDLTDAMRSYGIEIRQTGAQLKVRDYKVLSESITETQQLGIYASIAGVDRDRFFAAVAKNINDGDKVDGFMLWSHLWLEGANGLSIAKTVWSNTKSLKLAWLIFQRFEGDARNEFGAIVRKDLEAAANAGQLSNYDDDFETKLKLAHYIPKMFLPDSLSEEIYSHWVDIKSYPPLVATALTSCLVGYEDAGTCEYMTNGHFTTLGLSIEDSSDSRNNILMFVKGQLIGSFKLTGDPSMIGLRNVVDKKGNLIVAIGGVYRLPVTLVGKLRSASVSQTEWSAVNLSELPINPSTFLLNDNAFSDTNSKDLIHMGREHFSKDELIDYILNDGSLDGLMNADKRQMLVPLLMRALDQKRKQLESAFKKRSKAA